MYAPLAGDETRRRSKLTVAQQQELYNIIVAGPEAAGFDCGIWNTAMIVLVIEKKFQVSYNPRYLSSLLKKMNSSSQKAKFISDQVDEKDWETTRQQRETKKWFRGKSFFQKHLPRKLF